MKVYVIRVYPSGAEYASMQPGRAMSFLVANPIGNPVIFALESDAKAYVKALNAT